MEINNTEFTDLYLINYNSYIDKRGEFVKTFNELDFAKSNLDWRFKESFYSISYKNVIRGMHFQFPPHDHEKLVYVVAGSIIDVVLDLRESSNTFGEFFSIQLSAERRNAIYIGKGFAHGFLSLSEENIVEYHTTTVQNKESEGGIKWNSFGFDWGIENPVISDRDNSFIEFSKDLKYFI